MTEDCILFFGCCHLLLSSLPDGIFEDAKIRFEISKDSFLKGVGGVVFVVVCLFVMKTMFF